MTQNVYSTNSKRINSTINRTIDKDIHSDLNFPFYMDDDWNKKVEDYFFAVYEYSKFVDAIDFHKLNNIYFDHSTLWGIKKLFMEDLEKKGASNYVKNEVAMRIAGYIENYNVVCTPKKVMIQEIDDLYYFCNLLIRDASMNGKKSTTKN